jgi:dipeptidase D
MKDAIKGLKPEALWSYFYELTRIPRESKNETQVIEFLIEFARKHQLQYKKDKTGNVVISKPGTTRAENAPGVVLQGHVDMVCEKNSDVKHDFRHDPIRMKRVGGFIKAEGTTLGSDNGIGVAAALAVLADKSLVHPPLEAVFTVDEETGLTGANALTTDFVKGRILLNLDTEEDGALYVGCAGGKDTEIFLPTEWGSAPVDRQAVLIRLKGLQGGHSGLDIDKGRANAVKQLSRVIWKAAEKFELRLFKLAGGNKHNAIPRETDAGLLVNEADLAQFKNFIRNFAGTLQNEFKATDSGLQISVEATNYPEKVLSKSFQDILLNLIYALPHGVKKMSFEIEGLVETSTNLAVVKTDAELVSILTSQRSSVASEIEDIADKVKATGLLAGGKVRQGTGYPAWQPNMKSKILKFMKETYKDLYGAEPEVKAIHAGLECGIIGEKFSGMDMISLGPTILGAHSPDERVEIETVEKFWDLLVEVLKRLALA